MTKVYSSDVIEEACHLLGVGREEFLSPTRKRHICWPRQEAMYAVRKLTGKSMPEIARDFGNREHTTVLHALRSVEKRIASDPDVSAKIDKIIEGAKARAGVVMFKSSRAQVAQFIRHKEGKP